VKAEDQASAVRLAHTGVVGGHETVLVVDDEEAIRSVVKTILSRSGYSTLAAGDGESAVRLYGSEQSIDLVIMDLGMRGMDGWECLRRLRAIDPGVRVLLMTGYGGSGLAERARQEGAVGLICKPFVNSELLAGVRKALDGQEETAPKIF